MLKIVVVNIETTDCEEWEISRLKSYLKIDQNIEIEDLIKHPKFENKYKFFCLINRKNCYGRYRI